MYNEDISYKLLKISTWGIAIAFALTMAICFDRTTGREIFVTARSLVIVSVITLLSIEVHDRTNTLILKEYEKLTRKGSTWGDYPLKQFTSDIYGHFFHAKVIAGMFFAISISLMVATVADRYVFRMFLVILSLFVLVGCQLQQKYVRHRINDIKKETRHD